MFLYRANKEGLVKVLAEVFRGKEAREAFKSTEPLLGVINVEFIVKELLRWGLNPEAYREYMGEMALFLPDYAVRLMYDRGDSIICVLFDVFDKRTLEVHVLMCHAMQPYNTQTYKLWQTYTFGMRRGWWKVLTGKRSGALFERR